MKKIALAIALGAAAINASAGNVPYTQAEKAGIKKCLPAIEKVTDFLIEDGSAGAHSVWGSKSPDTSTFSSMIERNFKDGIILTNVTVSPMPNGACYIEYQSIFNWNKPCLAVAQELEGAKYKTEINKDVSILQQGSTFIYLMPNGAQCTMVRKQIISDGLKK